MSSIPVLYLTTSLWFYVIHFKKSNFIYLFLAVLGLRCCVGFSLVAASGGYPPAAVHRLLTAVASLVAEHRQ